MISKIIQSVKAVFSPDKKPKSSIEYRDQPKWTVKHSSLEAQQPPADGWLSAHGRYNFRGWFDKG
jgi:hypothetical protein